MVHTRVTASEAQMLTPEEFASLLTVGNTPAVNGPPAAIPAEHSARLIALGYMVDLAGRLLPPTADVPSHTSGAVCAAKAGHKTLGLEMKEAAH